MTCKFLGLFSCIMLVSCGVSPCKQQAVTVARVSSNPWYYCGIKDGKRMFYTTSTISKQFNSVVKLGQWSAYDIKTGRKYMSADGQTMIIYPKYGWDGATHARTTTRNLAATLFHDALLHAMMNGAPITQQQADIAFHEMMKEDSFTMRKLYGAIVGKVGGHFTKPQAPRTLRIEQKSTSSKSVF